MVDQPRGADYLEALQHPAECFSDPELAGGTAEPTPLGLPRVRSGNVASVFKVTGASGRVHAVRCFVRRFDDVATRYEAITHRLARADGTWKVGFDFQPAGVLVGEVWYPIVRMDWSDAVPLLPWIESHLWDAAALSYAAMRFASLVESLRAAGIAHGDLQHGNILVAPGGDLRLVDYDGMYVPELDGMHSNERGHRNYAHPLRTRADFGPHLDAFPAWVVYASLAALSIDPLLWGRLDGGDECLLFRAADFADPQRSEALASLRAAGDPRLIALAGAVHAQLRRPLAEVTPLSVAVAPPPALELPHSRAQVRERQSLMEVLRTASVSMPVPDELMEARQAIDEEEHRAGTAFAEAERELRHREQVELQAIEEELRRTLSDLSAREQELYRAEHREQADALRVLQAQVLDGELARHRLVRAKLPQVTEQVVYALALDDVRTAADVADVVVEKADVFVVRPDGGRVRVGALGPDGARALMGWRRRVESRYQGELPQSLPRERVTAIGAAYAATRTALAEEGVAARAAAARRADAVRAAVQAERDRQAAVLRAAKQAAAARRLELDRDLSRARKAAAEACFTPTP
jgi:hypothetical protein